MLKRHEIDEMFRRLAGYIMLFALLIPTPSFAHSPYLIEGDHYIDPAGRELRLMFWYGDGIFGPDPGSVLLMDAEDNVYAQTPVGGRVGAVCFGKTHCYAYSHVGPVPVIYELPNEKLPVIGKYEKEYPEYVEPKLAGFISSQAYYIYPVIFMQLVRDNTVGILISLIAVFLIYTFYHLAKFLFRKKGVIHKIGGLLVVIFGLYISPIVFILLDPSFLIPIGLTLYLVKKGYVFLRGYYRGRKKLTPC